MTTTTIADRLEAAIITLAGHTDATAEAAWAGQLATAEFLTASGLRMLADPTMPVTEALADLDAACDIYAAITGHIPPAPVLDRHPGQVPAPSYKGKTAADPWETNEDAGIYGCRNCGELIYECVSSEEPRHGVWLTVYKLSVDSRQCFMRDGQPCEPVNEGHEPPRSEMLAVKFDADGNGHCPRCGRSTAPGVTWLDGGVECPS